MRTDHSKLANSEALEDFCSNEEETVDLLILGPKSKKCIVQMQKQQDPEPEDKSEDTDKTQFTKRFSSVFQIEDI